ncbi:acetoacetate--CoA ligase [Maritalea mediterranea]|uniref:Acetoacetate--CoA ligase n=1 Tax=Maritalea mediterranea TaxID=2909667 RepID=A0ABS9E5J5_9HYPH|nr:acetoacetate--CoA ligase [Maritalea mediterranea]MCF4097065.1 acetoacetate--CoA ligase [Maritalea mediterranea]
MPNEILWTPSKERQRASNLRRFAKATKDQHQCAPDDYDGLLRYSIDHPHAFYSSLWDQLGIVGDKGDRILIEDEDIRKVRFFPDAKLNYAENALKNADDRTAIIGHRDDGTRREISRKQLYDLVSQLVQAMKAKGVKKGDRVGAIVTNDIEAIALYLASSAMGAIWASCSPDFGPEGATDRLAQVEPKILFAVPHYNYAGKHINVAPSINAVAEEAKIEHVVLLDTPKPDAQYDVSCQTLNEFVAPFAPTDIEFERLEFDAPMVILFSSGTTGKPKCIMHRGAGLLIQHMKELVLHSDVKPNDNFFYFTTCGWMMWNWLVSGLAAEATLITFDGNPFYPKAPRLLDLIDQEQINIFGTSAKYIDALNNFNVKPRKTHSLDSLKAILSTGSPLLPENFDYIYRDWKDDVQLASISGGTDICGCFMGGVPTKPVHRGELQGAQLGMDLAILDDEGNELINQPGEFVCRNAHMTMPTGFWGDESGEKYRSAYFDKFENMWAHGDFVEKRDTGGYIIHGRSDATLNPGGVRIGTAEIYRQVETIDEIEEAIAVGQDWQGDQRVILFVRLKDGVTLDEELTKLIKTRIRKGATPRHTPAKVIAVDDIPRTRSGKISEIAVRDVIHGRKIKNTTALANVECLEQYKDLPELQG